MSYPGDITKCIKTPKEGGLPLTQLVIIAQTLGIRIPSEKKGVELRKYLCPLLAVRLISAEANKAKKAIKKTSEACVRQTDSAYVNRNAPPYDAKYCTGQRKIGNDGRIYLSSPDSRGYYRWFLDKAQPTTSSSSKTVSPQIKFPAIPSGKKKLAIKPNPKINIDILLPDAEEKDKKLTEDWIVMKTPEEDKRDDLLALNEVFRILSEVTTEEFKNPLFQKGLKKQFELIARLLNKYKIDPKFLSKEITNASVKKDLVTIAKLINLS